MLTMFAGFAQINIAFFNAATAARRFARTVAGAAQNAGENIRFPVDHVGIVILAGGDQADVFGDRRMCGARVLAINNFMKVFGVRNISGFQALLQTQQQNRKLLFLLNF